MQIYLIIGLVFVTCFLISFIILYAISRRRDPLQARLKDLQGVEKKERAPQGLRTAIVKKGLSLFNPNPDIPSGAKFRLAQAGYHRPQAVYDYYGAKAIFTLILGGIAVFIIMYFHLRSLHMVLVGAGGIILGANVPNLWIMHKIQKRREEIRRAVPNMLDLMVVCVEAGLGFIAAIHKLVDETRIYSKALSQELHIVTQEILIGKSKADAFRNLANRTGVEELRSLAVTLIQADKLGTSIATSLRVLAESMRFKRRQRVEEMANKTPVKLVFPLVFLVFPELLVILVGPALINIIKALSDVANK